MKDIKLLENIIGLYMDARKVKKISTNVYRGRSHTISGEVEDLFAYYLSKNIKYDAMYVDQPISFRIGDTSKTYYPDIVIQRGNILKRFIDIKMDMGWNRNGLVDFCKNLDERVDNISGTVGRLKNGETKDLQELKAYKKLKYIIVIISSKNNKQEILEDQIQEIEKQCKNVEVCVLSSGWHPNTYDETQKEILKNIGINDKDFNKLKELLT